jgi:hypothetical protein
MIGHNYAEAASTRSVGFPSMGPNAGFSAVKEKQMLAERACKQHRQRNDQASLQIQIRPSRHLATRSAGFIARCRIG